MELTEQPRSLVIIGGGYIALELAQMFGRLGTQVTLLQRSERILSEYQPEVSIALHAALTEEGVDIRTGTKIRGVRKGDGGATVLVETDGREGSVHAAQLLVATGRVPNTDGIGLEQAGVRVDERGFVQVNDELRTEVPHIWAAGDVIGTQTASQMATPVGAHNGNIAAGNALGDQKRKADHRVLPRTIFTDPQVAVVGLTDAEANARGFVCS
ncbi:MAG: FAD-dependent oxidoreductase [Candidatus Limnocylindria bacterium]